MRRFWSLIDWTTNLTQCFKRIYYCFESSREEVSICVIREILSMMSNVYSLDVLDAWKRFQIMILNFVCIAATSQRLDWLKNRFVMSNSNWSQRFLFWTNWILCWICDEADLWLINWRNFEKIFLFVCDSNFFWIVFLLFYQSMTFLQYRNLDDLSSVYFLKASRWCLWMYKRRCYWYDEMNVFSKSSRVKN